MKTYPTVEYKAGLKGIPYNNVNFARQAAEHEATLTQKPVVVYLVTNGNHLELTKIEPKVPA
jgi:hypothetical protein